MTQDQQAVELTKEIKKFAPAYSVRWVKGKKLFPDDTTKGYFQILNGRGKPHYSRRTFEETKRLITDR